MINMPFLRASVHASFMWTRLLRTRARSFRSAGPLALAGLVACAGCGDSSAPSPFVSSDASTDVRALDVTDGGASPEGAADGSAGRPGEWGGPCVDDRSCDDGVSCTSD